MATKPVPSSPMSTEPAAIVAGITAVVTAVLLVLVEFGVPLTNGQQTALQGLVAALAPIVAGIIIRQKVYSPASAQAIANDAAVTGNAADTNPPPPTKAAEVPRERWGIERINRDGAA